jgi:putative membrane protein
VGTGGAGADVRSDGEFVRDVASKNTAEIELSRVAVDKTTNRVVRAFAQMMIDDHGAALNKLKTATSGQAIEWPGELEQKQRETAENLATKQGAEFDREYLKAMIEGHQDLAAKLETRLDVQSLQEWKTAAAGRTERNALPDPKAQMADVQVRPNKSDDASSSRINEWAAETYPIVQKHLDNARAIENAMKKGSTS